MKKFSLLLLGWSLLCLAQAQNLAVETYTLPNGFTVMLNPDPTATEVSGAVMVKAGGKNDPADATGIAHYLEHLLFKGTTELGTTDYAAEKVHLDRIVALYDEAASSTDPEKRAALYAEINEEAVAASEYGLPNEFDKLLKSLGGTGINAFTNYDITFYYNSFPAHELARWLDLYSHRFQNPVFRSFQSELEVVYEEKNRSMDDFQRQLIETFGSELAKGHPYGDQLVLGTIDHLKNPSLSKMYAYFDTYYVANNMALILSGNFDAEAAKPLIAEHFSNWRTGEVPEYPDYPIRTYSEREQMNVRMTPVNVGIVGYKTVPDTHPDRFALEVAQALLSNSAETGYLDQLGQEGKLLFTGVFNNTLQEDGYAGMFFVPKIVVQSLPAAEKLVMNAVEKVRQGDFTDAQLAAIKSTLYKDFQTALEDPGDRAVSMGFCFSRGIAWEDYLQYPDRIAALSREEVMAVARQYFGEGRLVMYSRTGFPKKQKLQKPAYEPVTTDQKGESVYATAFASQEPPLPAPEFVDLEADVTVQDLPGGNTLYWAPNPVNDLFTLTVQLHVGLNTEPTLDVLADLLRYAGTEEHTATELKQALASLGARYSVAAERNAFRLTVTGIEKNLEPTLALLEELINQPVITETTLKAVVGNLETQRKLEQSSPNTMGRVLLQYGLRGSESPFLRRMPARDVKKLDPGAQAASIRHLYDSYGATVHYVGQLDAVAVASQVGKGLNLAEQGERKVPFSQSVVTPAETTIYLLHDKKAVQSQVFYIMAGQPFERSDLPAAELFNSYFGGGFSGLVLQEIREYRSLAYSASGNLVIPQYSPEVPTLLLAYTGSQADKTTDAVGVMLDLMQELPAKPERIPTLVKYQQQSALTERPSFRNLPETVEDWQAQGYTQDPAALAYAGYADLSMEDLLALHAKYLKGQPITITIYGDKNEMDLDRLAELGKVVEVTTKDVLVE